MNDEIFKRIIRINTVTVLLLFCLWHFLMFNFEKNKIISIDTLRAFSGIITLTVFFWWFYFKHGWKWYGLKNIVYKPNLNGTWVGTFKSDWKDKDGKGIPKADMVLVIRQDFLSINITTFTQNFSSYSYGESFLVDDRTGKRRLIYLYSKNPMQPNQADDRQGTCELQVFGKPENELVGVYWTHNKTNGFIKVKHKSKDHVETFGDAKNRWVSPEHWNLINK